MANQTGIYIYIHVYIYIYMYIYIYAMGISSLGASSKGLGVDHYGVVLCLFRWKHAKKQPS